MASWTAACMFNEGYSSILEIMEIFGMRNGRNAYLYAKERVSLRSQKMTENDVYETTEGLLYGPGIADYCKYKLSTKILLLTF